MADAAGEFTVRGGCAAGDVPQLKPDFLLKRRAAGSNGDVIDCGELTGEVPGDRCTEPVWISSNFKVEGVLAVLETKLALEDSFVFGEERDAQIAGVVGDDGHGADWSIEDINEQVQR